jgi:AcrR family transcriptional regulator
MSRSAAGTRDRILNAARDLLSTNHFGTASIATICRHAGITKSTYFRYFRNKESLCYAVAEVPTELVVSGIKNAPENATALQAVAAGMQQLLAVDVLLSTLEADDELIRTHPFRIVGLAHSITEALTARGFDTATAQLAAVIGRLALRSGQLGMEKGETLAAGDIFVSTEVALQELRQAASTLFR